MEFDLTLVQEVRTLADEDTAHAAVNFIGNYRSAFEEYSRSKDERSVERVEEGEIRLRVLLMGLRMKRAAVPLPA